MTAARRARERQYSEQAVSNLGTAAGTAFNNAAELQKRINPVSLPAQMMVNPYIAEAKGLLSDKVMKPALNTLTSSVFGDKPFGEMPIQMPRMAGGNRVMPNLQTREVDAMAVPNLVASEAGVPLNFMGAPLFAKGSKMINKIAGPDSGRGMFLSSLSNFIPGYYGGNAGGAVAKWAPENLARTVRDLLDPESRALFKTQGVTRGAQELGAEALEKGEVHKAVAQTGQYLARIREQGGREGEVADALLKMEELSDYIPARSYKTGDYKALVKENKLVPKTQATGRSVNIADNDLDIIESHFGRVWKEPDSRGVDVGFGQAEDAKLVIKAPGAGRPATGAHFNDVLYTAPFIKHVRKAFMNRTNVPHDELIATLQKAADKDKFSILDISSPENGIWITGGRAGTAITEGGINYLVKVQPNGRMIGVMSDEHNLYEQLAGKVQKYSGGVVPALDMMKSLIPHRLVAVTPPMVQNIRNINKAKSSARGVEKVSQARNPNQVEGTAKGMVEELIKINPSKEAVDAERLRNLGGGMLAVSALE
jgi:hypothetical protein